MADPNNPLLISQDELRTLHNGGRTKEDIARDAVKFWHERDEAREQLAVAQARIAELERQHNALHDALRTMAQSWLALAASYDASPRKQGEAETLQRSADDLAATFDAALAGDEPAKE